MIFKEETAEELRKKTRDEIIADIRRDTLVLDLMFLEVKRDIEELLEKHKHKSNPNVHLQPRHPRGTSEGGQWMRDGDSSTLSTSRGRDGSFEVVFSDYPTNDGRREAPRIVEEPIELTKITIPSPNGRIVDRVNIFVGGLLDESDHNNVLGSSSMKKEIYGDNYYATHDQDNDINKFIAKLPKDKTVNIIGHSWGGDTAAKIAIANPGRVNMLVTVDPTSWFWPDFKKVSKNVSKWININAIGERDNTGRRVRTRGDNVAGLGRSWDTIPESYANLFISAPFGHEYFDDMLKYKPFTNKLSANEILNTIIY